MAGIVLLILGLVLVVGLPFSILYCGLKVLAFRASFLEFSWLVFCLGIVWIIMGYCSASSA